MTKENKKPDFVLPDGREVIFDFSDVTLKEWREVRDPAQPPEEEDKFIARVAKTITPEEIESLDMLTWRRLTSAMFAAAFATADGLVISDGRTVGEDITFDFSKLTVKEWRDTNTDDEEFEVIRRIGKGLPDDLDNVLFTDWRKIKAGFYREAVNPLADQS